MKKKKNAQRLVLMRHLTESWRGNETGSAKDDLKEQSGPQMENKQKMG